MDLGGIVVGAFVNAVVGEAVKPAARGLVVGQAAGNNMGGLSPATVAPISNQFSFASLLVIGVVAYYAAKEFKLL